MIVVVPALTPVTTPDELTVATEGFDDDQDTALFVAFEGVTVAVKVPVPPTPISIAVLSRETPVTDTVGAITVTVHDPYLFVPSVAVALMVAVPAFTAVTTPDELTVATEGSDDDHDTALFVAFEGVTVAV